MPIKYTKQFLAKLEDIFSEFKDGDEEGEGEGFENIDDLDI